MIKSKHKKILKQPPNVIRSKRGHIAVSKTKPVPMLEEHAAVKEEK